MKCKADRDVTELAKIRICHIWILYFKSVGFGLGCGFVARSHLKYTYDSLVNVE